MKLGSLMLAGALALAALPAQAQEFSGRFLLETHGGGDEMAAAEDHLLSPSMTWRRRSATSSALAVWPSLAAKPPFLSMMKIPAEWSTT